MDVVSLDDAFQRGRSETRDVRGRKTTSGSRAGVQSAELVSGVFGKVFLVDSGE